MKSKALSPDVSVIVCTYNHGKWIERCLRSLVNQDFIKKEEYEVIIVDDCSKDYTQKILKNFQFDNFRFYKNKKNLGLPKSLNRAIKLSFGKYIVRVDSDDYVNRNFLLILYMMVNLNDDYSAVACDYYLVNDNEKILEQVDCDKEPIGCGIIFEKDHIKSVGLYNEKYLINEEKEFRKRYEKKYSVKRLSLPLYRYRRHSENMTNQNEK